MRSHSVFLRTECILPERLKPLLKVVGDNWNLVEEITAPVFDTMIRQAGWHFTWMQGPCSRRGFAFTQEAATLRALARALRGIRSDSTLQSLTRFRSRSFWASTSRGSHYVPTKSSGRRRWKVSSSYHFGQLRRYRALGRALSPIYLLTSAQLVCSGFVEIREDKRKVITMSLIESTNSKRYFEGVDRVVPVPIGSDACSLPLPTRIAFIGNYLPRECGIATFTTDLCSAFAKEYGAERLFAIPVNDPESSYDYPEQVRLEIEQEDLGSYERAADFLNFNGNDLVCLQHEYGIYGGNTGRHILALLRKLKMPLVTTLHTVLREPDANQRARARRDRAAL